MFNLTGQETGRQLQAITVDENGKKWLDSAYEINSRGFRVCILAIDVIHKTLSSPSQLEGKRHLTAYITTAIYRSSRT